MNNNTTEHDDEDIPMLEEVVFPDNAMDETLSNIESVSRELTAEDENRIKETIQQKVANQLDQIIEQAIFRTLQDSIAMMAEEMKDEVKGQIEQELSSIINDAFKGLK